MQTSRLGCRRNRRPRRESVHRVLFRWTAMASTSGGSCLRIGSYWRLARSYPCTQQNARTTRRLSHLNGQRHWSPCACPSSAAWLTEAVRWRHGPTIPKKSEVRSLGSHYRLHGISPSLHRSQIPREDSYNPSIGFSRYANICKKASIQPEVERAFWDRQSPVQLIVSI